MRVTSPRMSAVKRPSPRSARREIDEQTGIGEIYMRSLLRTQLRQGLTAIATLVLVLAVLPLVFATEPQLATVRIITVPLPWVLIGVGMYPFLFLLAWWLQRAADRAEQDFAEIVSPTSTPKA